MLYMVMLGGNHPRAKIEVHDVVFAAGDSLEATYPALVRQWFGDPKRVHIDAWMRVSGVDDYAVQLKPTKAAQGPKLFFVNLGGYKDNDFEEYHYKQLIVAKDIDEASRNAKQSPFYHQHISPHIDDKYGIDVDDVYPVEDIMDESSRQQFGIVLTAAADGNTVEDKLHIGYLKFSDLEKI